MSQLRSSELTNLVANTSCPEDILARNGRCIAEELTNWWMELEEIGGKLWNDVE